MSLCTELPKDAPAGMGRVEGIEPHLGYILLETSEDDSDGFSFPVWFAWDGEDCHLLHVSRFKFTPTQDRFNWMVEWGFPTTHIVGGGYRGQFTNDLLDALIRGEETATHPQLAHLVAGHKQFLRDQAKAGRAGL